MKRYLTLVFLLILGAAGISYGQEEVELRIGQTLYFGDCTGKTFESMDLYVKTRFEETKATYDPETGAGFYDFFFGTGDFDVKRLPCKYSKKTCQIVSFQDFKDTGGNTRTVLFARVDNDHTVVWIEIEMALEKNEILFSRN